MRFSRNRLHKNDKIAAVLSSRVRRNDFFPSASFTIPILIPWERGCNLSFIELGKLRKPTKFIVSVTLSGEDICKQFRLSRC